MSTLINYLGLFVSLLIGLGWFFCLAAPLGIILSALFYPSLILRGSMQNHKKKLIHSIMDSVCLEQNLREALDSNEKDFTEACVCASIGDSGVTLATQIRVGEKSWSTQVVGKDLVTAAELLSIGVSRQDVPLCPCGPEHCINAAYCPNKLRFRKSNGEPTFAEVLRFSNSTAKAC